VRIASLRADDARRTEQLLWKERDEKRKSDALLQSESEARIRAETALLESKNTKENREVTTPVVPTVSVDSTSSVSIIIGTTTGSVLPYPKLEDVTVARYENTRLGFLMELPKGWYLAYERGEDVAFASEQFPFGSSYGDIKKNDGTLWVRVTRPCTSTEARTVIFSFATTTDMTIREATSCIPPFLVTLGYRANVAHSSSREQFLLNLGRTFYPMVSPVAPYAPIR